MTEKQVAFAMLTVGVAGVAVIFAAKVHRSNQSLLIDGNQIAIQSVVDLQEFNR